MMFPNHLPENSPASAAPRARYNRVQKIRDANLKRELRRVKQKRGADADFLGDTGFWGNVVDVCCIPTTKTGDSRVG
jgi:hypothetical protein